ncbi:hypothetical protein Avbf_00004 [Armadillidium vulgare]|nr:hypothetical protein Avbf_00004 [Armadillidium vulgare]
MKILGASKIFLYQTTCHENVRKVLEFYEEEGTVKLITFYYPPPSVQEGTFLRLWTKSKLWEYRAGQYMYLNDCLLRNKHQFDYLGIFDYDEIPILKVHKSFQKMIKFYKPRKNYPESYMLRWKTLYKDLHSSILPHNMSKKFYILVHNQRTKLFPKEDVLLEKNGKTFHNTNQIYWVNPHKHINIKSKLGGTPILRRVSRRIAYTAHYRQLSCSREQNCYKENLEVEKALHSFQRNIIENVERVHKRLKLFT